MRDYLSLIEIEEISKTPSNRQIDFSRISEITFPRSDILNSELTGKANNRHFFSKGNIVDSKIVDFTAESVDFQNVDFKDCIIRNTKFIGSSFDDGAIINNVFNKCSYNNCHFKNMAITNSQFDNIQFIDCDLSNMVIKGCKFLNCEFINCKTSNKLIESSIVFECKFINTNIQIQTITDNFGIKKNHLINSKIRSNRKREDHSFFSNNDITQVIEKTKSSFHKVKLIFFLDSNVFIKGDSEVDELFKLENWLELCKIPSTFIDNLNLFLEFILFEYNRNNLLFVIILKLHDMTSQLIHNGDLSNSLYTAVMGVHMTLARKVEVYLRILYDTIELITKPDLFLKVNGPIDAEFYYDEFNSFIDRNSFKIIEVKKMNSPNMLHLLWENLETVMILSAVIYATRVKLEISAQEKKIQEEKNDVSNNELQQIESVSEKNSLFTIDVGLKSAEKKYLYSLKLKSIIPGNLVADLSLSLNTKFLGRIRTILVDILVPPKQEV